MVWADYEGQDFEPTCMITNKSGRFSRTALRHNIIPAFFLTILLLVFATEILCVIIKHILAVNVQIIPGQQHPEGENAENDCEPFDLEIDEKFAQSLQRFFSVVTAQ